MKKYSALQHIACDHTITPETDGEFLYQLQNALLLALKEHEQLDTVQYRHAAEKLNQQRNMHFRKNLQTTEDT